MVAGRDGPTDGDLNPAVVPELLCGLHAGRIAAASPASGVECAGAEEKARVIVGPGDCGKGIDTRLCWCFQVKQRWLDWIGAALRRHRRSILRAEKPELPPFGTN